MPPAEYPKEVKLKDGVKIVLKPFERKDKDALYTFFQRLPESDRLFLVCGALLDKVGLHGAASRRFRGYSKGMRQRLGFAQAMLGNPSILFLDEPTNGLDPEGIREFYQILSEIRSHGATIVLTSHILSEIQERVDRLAIMKMGKIHALGTVQTLRDKMALPLIMHVTMQPGSTAALLEALASLGFTGNEQRMA